MECLSFPLSLSVSPTGASGNSTVSQITSNSVTVTATGGTGGSKTYSWDFTSNPSSITALSPTSAATAFRKTGAITGSTHTATARCTVSDGTNTTSITVPVTLERADDGT